MNLQSTSFSKKILTFLFFLFPIICNAQGQTENPNLILRKFFSVSWGILILAVTLYFAIKYVKEKRFHPNKPSPTKFLLFWGLAYPMVSTMGSYIVYAFVCAFLKVPTDFENNFVDGAFMGVP